MHPYKLLAPLAILAIAAAAPAQADVKIGAIKGPALLQASPQYKDAQVKFKAEFDKKEKDLMAEGSKLQDDVKKYQRDGDSMSAQQRATTEKDLNTRRIDFDLKQRQFQEEVQKRQGELQRDILEKIGKAIEDVAKEKNIDMVVQDPAYVSNALDLTDDVLKKLGVAAAPAKK